MLILENRLPTPYRKPNGKVGTKMRIRQRAQSWAMAYIDQLHRLGEFEIFYFII